MGGMPYQNMRQPMPYPQQRRPAPAFRLALPQFDVNEWEQSKLDRDARRNFVGNLIYEVITTVDPANAAKITGMLIDENVVDQQRLLTSEDYLNEKYFEADALLK